MLVNASHTFAQNTLTTLGLTSSTPAAGAYSLRKLSSSYTGFAIQVRRSSDNTLQNIGFTASGDLDTVALKSFVANNSGFVATWYDQSGNGRNATQTTNATQPRIVNGGTIDRQNSRPALAFLGAQFIETSLNGVQATTSGNTTTANAVFTTASSNSSIISNNNTAAAERYNIHAPWGYGLTFFDLGDAGAGGRLFGGATYTSLSIGTFQRNNTNGNIWKNGISVASASSMSTTLTSTNNLLIGAMSTTSLFITGSMAEVVIFSTAISTANRQSMECNQGIYYNISPYNDPLTITCPANISLPAGRVVFEDFETGATGWSDNTTETDPNISRFLGRFAGSAGAQAVSKTFTMPGTASKIVTFDLYRLDSWDGEAFRIFVNDVQVASFSPLASSSGTVGGVSWTATVNNVISPNVFAGWTDHLVKISLTINDGNASCKIGFGSMLDQSIPDESYGIDNFSIVYSGTSSCSTGLAVENPVINNSCSLNKLTWSTTGATIGASATSGINYIGTYNFNIGTTTVNYQATDVSGNVVNCSFTVTVNMNAATINKAVTASASTLCAGSPAIVSVALSDVGVNYQLRDASNVNIGSPVAGTGSTINLPTGNINTTTTFNVLATNVAAGCSFSLTNTVTITVVVDNIAPIISCLNNINVTAALGACTAPVSFATPTVTDNCSSCTSTPAISGFISLGLFNGTAYYVSNSTANYTTASAAATAAGGQLASITSAAENTFIRNAVTASSLGGVTYWAGGNDNLTEGTWAWPTCEAFTYTNWQSGEPNGGTGENCLQVYGSGTWNDLNTAGVMNYVIEVPCNGITPVRTTGLASGSNFPVGVTTVTYTATDAAGNIGTRSFTVTVNMNAATINKTVTASASTLCAGSPAIVSVALSDVGVNYQLRDASNVNIGSPVAGTGGTINLPTGNLNTTTTFNILATNVATGCTFNLTNTATITVAVDNIAPIISCLNNINVTAALGACTAPVSFATPTVTDNCSSCTSTPAISGFISLGLFNGTAYYVSNSTANYTTASAAATAAGGQLASITSAAENTFIRNAVTASSLGGVTYWAGGNDNLTEGTWAWPTCESFSYTNWNTSEPNGGTGENCLQINGNGTWNDWNTANVVNYVIEVPCNGITPVRTTGLASGSNFPVGVTTVTYTATDAAGNIGTRSFTVTVNMNAATINKTVTASASSLCAGSPAIVYVALSDVGVNYQLRDASNVNIGSPVAGTGGTINLPTGNINTTTTFNVLATNVATSCTFNLTNTATITVAVDNIAPIISCLNNITVNLAQGACTAPVSFVTPTVTDNCSSCTSTPAITGFISLGLYNGTAYYVSNSTANYTTASAAATAAGGQLASITSAAENTFIRNAVTASSLGGVTYWAGGNDNLTEGTWAWPTCESFSYTNWNTSEPNGGTGENCLQINGNGTWNDWNTANVVNYVIEVPCNGITPVRTTGLASGSNFPVGVTTVTYTATDAAGNIGTRSFTVTVNMNAATINKTVTASASSLCAGSPAIVYVALSDVGVNYQLRDASNVNIGSPVAGTGGTINLPTGNINTTTTFNVLATNVAAGCSFSLTNTVTITVVVDNIAPIISCLNNINVTAALGACTAPVSFATPTVTDNCSSCTSTPAITGFISLGLFNGTAYYVSNSTANYTTASAAATAAGGQLASITSAAENTFIRNAVTASSLGGVTYWAGGNDNLTEGTWAWPTCESFSYTNWNTSEPNGGTGENCLQVYGSGTWNDLNTAGVMNYVIEVPCNGITPLRTSGLASGSNFPVGVTTVTYTATDASGNIGTRNFTVTVNINPATINKTVTASNTTVCFNTGTNIQIALSDVGVSYQLRNASNVNIGSPVVGTGGTINLPTGNLSSTTTFNIQGTNTTTSCTFNLTNTATVTVTPAATVTPGSTLTSCQSGTPTAITLTGASIGGSATTGAWSITTGGGTLSSTAQTATPGNVTYTPAANFSGTVTLTLTTNVPAGCSAGTSATRTITVNPIIANNTINGAQNICTGVTPSAFTGSTPTGGDGSYTYQWQSSTTSISTGYAAAAGVNNTANYIAPTALTQTTWYRRVVTSGTCSSNSTVAIVLVDPAVTNNTISASQSVCSGSVPTALTGAVPGGGAGAGSYTYYWETSTTSATTGFSVASGVSNGINYTPSAVTQTTWYRRTVTTGGCTSVSPTVQVSIFSSAQWIGGSTGDWNNPSNWCGGIPTSSSNVVIPAGATVNIQSANAVAGSVTIAATASLVMTGAHNLTITAGGTFTNNGTFTATTSTGAVIFAGAGTIAGTTSFQNIQTSGALNFGTASTVNGNFTIQTGGSVTGNAPTYTCPSSTLIYRTGGTFARGIEWATNPTGQGYPSNVLVQSNTIINFPIPGQGYVCNDLTIEDGSVLNQNFASGSASLQVGRNVTIAGTLTLGGASGGDINVGGNWTRTSTGVFNHNERKVTFDGTGNFSGRGLAMSTISAPASSFKDNEGGFGGEKFAHLWMNKAAATDSLVLLSNVTITREIGFTRGTFSLRNSDVTLVSNTTRTADIAPVTTPANIAVRYAGTGRFNIQRFVHNPTAVRSWRLLTAPVEAASAPSINTAWQYGTVNPDRTNPTGADGIYNPWPGYGTHITGPGGTYNLASGFDHGTNSASILQATANVAGWVAPANTKGTLVTDQQGWMLFVRGDRGYAIGSQYTPSQSTTLETRGKVLIGDVVRPVAAGRQVIANPYASAISLANIDLSGTGNTNANVYYTWDPKFFTSYTQPGKWVTFTRAGSTFVSTTSASNYSNTGVIESGQAFVIQPSVAGNVTFKESDKLPLTSSLIGVANRPTNQTFGMLRSDLYVNNGGVFTLTDAVVNLFDEDYTNTVDEEDANKLITFNTKESLSLQRDTSKLAIEKRSKIISTDTIYYSLSKLNELPYQFRFKASNIPVGLTAYVEDKFTNSRTVVNLNGETIVDFTITADPLSKVMDRFKMVFKLQGPLPVKITTLTATKQSNSKVAVDWKVESETNVSSYYIEKSTDGIHFSTVAVENAYGNNTRFATYQWLDTKPFNGRNFYRLKVLDFDGTFTYSQIVQVSFDNKSTISIFPNPIENNTIQVVLNGVSKGNYQVQLYNKAGQLITNTIIVVNATDMMTKIPIASTLAKGIYDAIIISPEGIKTNLKVAVQ